MPKNIALFIDGTWNKSVGKGNPENTNVLKLYEAAVHDGQNQITNYIKGVGTAEWTIPGQPQLAENFQRILTFAPRWTHKIVAGGTGLGTANRIREAYQFLSGNYDPGDKVYLFGFSRGAFAARSLAGFIEAVGLLLKDFAYTGSYVEKAYSLYKNGLNPAQSELRGFLRDMTGQSVPNVENRRVLPIYFIGVWDTVAALGVPSRLRAFNAYFTEYHQPQLPSNVTHARHALALHELREKFEPLLWTGRHPKPDDPDQSVMQVCFVGAHGDVGGGYDETRLSDIALDWMMQEAEDNGKGLKLRPKLPDAGGAAVPAMVMHHEIRGVFKWSTPVVRKILRDRSHLSRETLETFFVHVSATKHLLNKKAQHYKFREHVKKALAQADDLTLKFHLELSTKHGKVAVGTSDPVHLGPRGEPEKPQERVWWDKVNVEDASNCEISVRQFFETSNAPSPEEIDKFAQSLFIWVTCDSATAVKSTQECLERMCAKISELLKAGKQRLDEVDAWRKKLEEVVAGVNRCAGWLPSELKVAVDKIEKYAREDIVKFQLNRSKALYAGPQLKLNK
jgi:uncharacterized protein (DUF2235 family)